MASDLTVGLDMIAAATVPTKPAARLLWGVVESAASPVQVVLENDTSATSRPVSGNAAGPVAVGDRVLLARQRRRLAIVANPTAQARLLADTDWVTSGVVSPSAGVSVGSCRFRRVGPWVSCDIYLTATVAYTIGPTGDISNSVYNAQITDARFLPSGGSQAIAAHGSAGRLVSAAVETSGRILIGALGGTSDIAVGDVFRMGGVYLAG